MNRFETITIAEPASQWRSLWLVPGTLLVRNGERFRIVGSCRGRQRLLLRRLS